MATNPLPHTTSTPNKAPANVVAINEKAMMDFAFKVVGDLAAAMSGPLIYIGDRLGLFKLLAADGPLSVEDLAQRTGLKHRYLREWSSAMVAAEYLSYDPATQKVSLNPEHAKVLADEDSPVFVGGLAQMIPDHYTVIPKVIQAFRDGGGVPYDAYSADTFEGTERLFRTGYLNFLVSQWIPQMPDVLHKLQSGAKVADVGCGRGQALLQLARAFPSSQLFGYDNFAPGLAYANEVSRRERLDQRLRYEERNSAGLPQTRDFDLIMTCDSLHDMVSPEDCAKSIFGALDEDGTWFVIEPNIRDRVEENINPLGKLFYSVSMLQCMTCSLAQNGAGYGAGMGEGNVRRIALATGFSQFRKLPIENPFNQFFEIKK